MAERHVDALFATAYDGRLDDAQRHRFDRHLESCEQCAAGFADHCAAGDALRSLPALRMPVPVRLPSHAPRAAHRSLRERLGLPSGVALSLVGAGAAAIVIGGAALALHNAGQNTRSQGAAEGFIGAAGSAASISSASASSSGAAAAAPLTAFTNAVTVQRSGRQGETLVLATTGQSYPAGATIQVDARLVLAQRAEAAAPAQSGASHGAPAPLQGAALAPDLALAPVIASPEVSLLPSGGPARGTDRLASPSPLAIASSAGSPGFFELVIPASAKPGDVLTIVASVPAGVPLSGDSQPVTAVLQITVS